MAARRPLGAAGLLVAVACLAACAPVVGPTPERVEPLRLSERVDRGDPARRASTRLVLDGLDEDAAGRSGLARAAYERALQVDPSNPWAYLALARHHAESRAPGRALPFLDKAEASIRAEGEASPGVEAHLVGLRGVAARGAGRTDEAEALLERARTLAPEVWTDGRLSAEELR